MPIHTRAPQVEDLLASLGIRPERCMGLTIDCRPGNVVHVTADLLLEKDEVETLTNTIKHYYKLVPLETESAV